MDWNLFTAQQTGVFGAIMVLNVGAAYRLSRLIARDTLTDGPRDRIQAKYHGLLVDGIHCMWCLTFWFAIFGALLTAWDLTRPAWLVIASVLTIATFAGLLSERG